MDNVVRMNIHTIVPILWEILSKNKKRSINLTTRENEIIISIWSGLRWKRFRGKNADNLVLKLRDSYHIV